MIARLLGTGLVVASLGSAPFQCGGGNRPDVKAEDSPGDALYDLAMDFRAKGNEAAARETLRYLVEHYPSSRRAPAARADLAEGARGADAPRNETAPAGSAPAPKK